VNAISLRVIEKSGWIALAPNEKKRKAMIAQTASGIPLNRLAHSEEIAKAAVFLASDDSTYATGTELLVEAGAAQIWQYSSGRFSKPPIQFARLTVSCSEVL
jgi:NAD(P)-dependent dehydrogenase (short-subunit alcohol dehydrogenase family)